MDAKAKLDAMRNLDEGPWESTIDLAAAICAACGAIDEPPAEAEVRGMDVLLIWRRDGMVRRVIIEDAALELEESKDDRH